MKIKLEPYDLVFKELEEWQSLVVSLRKEITELEKENKLFLGLLEICQKNLNQAHKYIMQLETK